VKEGKTVTADGRQHSPHGFGFDIGRGNTQFPPIPVTVPVCEKGENEAYRCDAATCRWAIFVIFISDFRLAEETNTMIGMTK